MDEDALERDLLRPEAYPERPESVETLETHVSRLFFAGGRVYKVKKAVDLGFVDTRSLAERRRLCEEELRLNRRLAPRVYRGVVPLVRGPDGHLAVAREAAPEEAVEWAVEMVRLPAHRMLSSLLERAEIDNERLDALVELLVEFHRRCPTGPGVDEHGTEEQVRANALENFEQLAPFAGLPAGDGGGVVPAGQLAFLRERCEAALAANEERFERRVAEGRIREGHGDLHAGNLCFTDAGIVAYDCLEFAPRFRCADVAADVAFLAMDLDQRGFPAFSRYLVHRYAKRSGDAELGELVDFYKVYRAVVRGKVEAMTAAGTTEDAQGAREHRLAAARYLQLAVGYELPPLVVALSGLPATGKSWLAARLARPLRASLLRSDVRRKTLAGASRASAGPAAVDAGLYTPERRQATYRSLLEQALATAREGRSVVLDATFDARDVREQLREACAAAGVPALLVHVTADEGTVRARLEARAADPEEASEAGLAVYLAARERFEPPEEWPAERRLEVRSGGAPAETATARLLDRAIAAVGAG